LAIEKVFNRGTRGCRFPEALYWNDDTVHDPRVDIYAVGVTFMELLTAKNPFVYLSREEIIQVH
jgi:serine/threonine protein kinase